MLAANQGSSWFMIPWCFYGTFAFWFVHPSGNNSFETTDFNGMALLYACTVGEKYKKLQTTLILNFEDWMFPLKNHARVCVGFHKFQMGWDGFWWARGKLTYYHSGNGMNTQAEISLSNFHFRSHMVSGQSRCARPLWFRYS